MTMVMPGECRVAWEETRKTRSTQVAEEDLRGNEGEGDDNDNERNEWIYRLLRAYQSSATIHGIALMSRDNLYHYRGHTWVLLVLIMTGATSYFLVQQVTHYLSYPINTIFLDTMEDTNREFPSIMICPTNPYATNRLPSNELTNFTILHTSFFNTYTIGTIAGKRFPLWLMDMPDVSGEDLINATKHAEHRLEDVLVHCTWKRGAYPCAELFQPYLTWQGTCYRFNWNRTHPFLIHDPAPWDGLNLVIDSHKDALTAMPFSGIMIMLKHSRYQSHPLYGMWTVRPGIFAQMRLRIEQRSGLADPYKAYGTRTCVETESAQFVNPSTRFWESAYHVGSCMFDCQLSLMVKLCGCYHYNDPAWYDDTITKTAPLCTAKQIITCYFPHPDNTRLVEMGDMMRSLETSCTHCPLPCTLSVYNPIITYLDINAAHVLSQLSSTGSNGPFDARHLIALNVYLSSLIKEEIKQVPETNLWGVLGSFGGLLGLFIGASLLSLVEVAELLVLLLTRLIGNCLEWLLCPRRQRGLSQQQQ